MTLNKLTQPNYLILIVMFFICQISFGQNLSLTTYKANNKVQMSEFDKGIELYHKVFSKDSTYYKANIQLAHLYCYTLDKFDSASFYYERAFRHQKKDTNYYNYYGYANSLRMTNQPKKAKKHYNLFKTNFPFKPSEEDLILQSELKQNIAFCEENIIKVKNVAQNITVKNVGHVINSDNNEYTSVFVRENSAIIYNGRHKDFNDEILYIDDQFFENVYCYQLDDNTAGICNLSENQSTHYAVVNSVGTGDSILVYYENKLWISSYDGYSIKKKKPLPSILSGYYQQPTGVFTKDQKTFIFSAKKNMFDDLNLYVSYKNEKSEWSKPEKIKTLNTKLNEDSPFLSEDDQTLYFSSEGHKSSGNYDIYKSILENGEWQEPINLGYPINSPGDDIFYETTSNGKGFLSSNRLGGYGLMDIYEVNIQKEENLEEIVAIFNVVPNDNGDYERTNSRELTKNKVSYFEAGVSEINNEPITKYTWTINDSILTTNSSVVPFTFTNIDSQLIHLEVASANYSQTITKPFYVIQSDLFTENDTTNNGFISGQTVDSLTSQNTVENEFVFNPIYFGFDKHNIDNKDEIELDKLLAYLNSHPNAKIIITGHTDSMGSAAYNKTLAEKRIHSTIHYLKSHNLKSNRIHKTVSFGESKPAVSNTYENGADNAAGRQLNRRVAFILYEPK